MNAYVPFRLVTIGLTAAMLIYLVIPIAGAQEPTPLMVAVSIDQEATFDNRSGGITVTGTITCSEPTAFADLFVQARQFVGRFKVIFGSAFTNFGESQCGPVPTNWELTVFGDSGKFGLGIAIIRAEVFACDIDFQMCDSDRTEASVRLRP